MFPSRDLPAIVDDNNTAPPAESAAKKKPSKNSKIIPCE
jgi:hypothetical protein